MKVRLEAASHSTESEAYQRLTEKSKLGPQVFNEKAIKKFIDSFDPNMRHLCAHIKYTPLRLLREMMMLESLNGRVWDGPRDECPEVVALRFYLTALGPETASQLVQQLREDNGREYRKLDEEQIERLGQYLSY